MRRSQLELAPGVIRAVEVLLPIGFVLAALWIFWLRFNVAPGSEGSDYARGLLILGDLLNYYVPMTEHVGRRLAAGEVPLWNPEACSGIPLLATLQLGVLYPGTWLAAAMPAHRALPALALLECALGGLFSFWFLRAWGFARCASALGGALFVWGCCLGQTLWPPAVACIVWIPWLLLCVEKLCERWSGRWWAGLVLGCAVQLLAGFPQYVAYGYFLVAPYAALRLLGRARRREIPRRSVGVRGLGLVAAIALGVGLAAVQLLPSLELVSESVRSQRLAPEEVHYLNLGPLGSRHSTGAFLRRALDPSPGSITYAFGPTGYVGTATLLLLAAGVVARARDSRTWLLLALGASALVLSDGYLGPAQGLYALYAKLPVAGNLRTPERLRLLAYFSVAALAAAGFDALERPPGEARPRLLVAATLVLAALGLAAGMAAAGRGAATWRVGLAVTLALLPLQSASPAWLRRAAAASLAVFVIADLAMATPETGFLRSFPISRSHFYSSPKQPRLPLPLLERQRRAVGSARLELVHFLPLIASGPSAGLRRVACYEPLIPRQWAELQRRLAGEKTSGSAFRGLEPEAHALFYDVTSVRRILVSRRGRIAIFQNDDALPRAYLIGRYRIASDAEAIEHLARGDVDVRSVVLLERDPEPPLEPAEFRLVDATVIEDEPERVTIEVDAPAPGLLVLTDTHYPDWEARVGGQRTEVLRANGLHRAVRVGAGRQRIVFEYRPRSFRRGATVSLASLAILLGAVALTGRRRAGGGPCLFPRGKLLGRGPSGGRA